METVSHYCLVWVSKPKGNHKNLCSQQEFSVSILIAQISRASYEQICISYCRPLYVMFSKVYYNYEYSLYYKQKQRLNYVRPIPGVSLRNWMDCINNSAITRFSHLRYMPVQRAPKFILLLMPWCSGKSVKVYMPPVPAEKALKPTAYCSTTAIYDLLDSSQEELGGTVRSTLYSSSVKVFFFVGR